MLISNQGKNLYSNFILLSGLTVIILFFLFNLKHDLTNTYQYLEKLTKGVFLNPSHLKYIASHGIQSFLIWTVAAGAITILATFLHRTLQIKIFHIVSVLFVLILIKMFFTNPLELYGGYTFHYDRYLWGLDISLILFLFIPAVLFLAKTEKEKIVSLLLITAGFFALFKVDSAKGLFFYSLSFVLSSIFAIKKEKKYLFYIAGVLSLLAVIGIAKGYRIIEILKNRKDLYLDNILLTLYTKEVSFLPKSKVLYSTKTVYNLWTDFIPIYILEKFGWIVGLLIVFLPIAVFLYGLSKSIKNLKSDSGKLIFVLSITLIIYTVVSLLPIIPGFFKYGLYYPLYGHITGMIIFYTYALFLITLKPQK